MSPSARRRAMNVTVGRLRERVEAARASGAVEATEAQVVAELAAAEEKGRAEQGEGSG